MQLKDETGRERAIELLSERLVFEQASVALYDSVLERLRPRGGPYETVKAHLRRIREEKKSNEEFLAEELRILGGGQPSDHSLVLLEEWRSIAEALAEEDADPSRLFHALMLAEVYDSGGWELLLDLAARNEDVEAAQEFRQRLGEGQEHFLFVSRIVAKLSRSVPLDDAPMSAAP